MFLRQILSYVKSNCRKRKIVDEGCGKSREKFRGKFIDCVFLTISDLTNGSIINGSTISGPAITPCALKAPILVTIVGEPHRGKSLAAHKISRNLKWKGEAPKGLYFLFLSSNFLYLIVYFYLISLCR
jgi:hypothetical protein